MLGSGLNCQPPKYKQSLLLVQHTRVMILLSSWLDLAEQGVPLTAGVQPVGGSDSMFRLLLLSTYTSLPTAQLILLAGWQLTSG